MQFFSKFLSQRWAPYALFLMLGFLLYFKILSFELVYLDDNVWLKDYHWYLKDLSNAAELFKQHDLITGIFYRPILNLSFMLDAQWGADNPWAYHLCNIVIHLLNSCLIFILLRKLGYERLLSFFMALIFLCHPVFVTATAWIPGRTDSLLGTFIFLSLILYLQFLEKRKWVYFILHIMAFILALLVKETALVLPFLLLIFSFFLQREKRSIWVYFVVWILVLGGWWIIRQNILSQSMALPPGVIIKTLIENLPAFLAYIGKVILPINLSVIPILKDLNLIYGLIVVTLISFALGLSKDRRLWWIFFGVIWFLAFLLPSFVLSFIKHEYRLYVPLLGFIIVLLEIDFIKNLSMHPKRLMTIGSSVVLILAFTTFRYSDEFKDRFTFWNNAVKTSPHSPLAHRNLGAMYHLEGELDKAEPAYKKALELNPMETMVHNNLGLIYRKRGLNDLAEKEFRAEIEINPTYDNVYYNYGLLLYSQKRVKEAEAAWRKSFELNPRYVDAYKALASLCYIQGRIDEAKQFASELTKRGIPIPEELQGIFER